VYACPPSHALYSKMLAERTASWNVFNYQYRYTVRLYICTRIVSYIRFYFIWCQLQSPSASASGAKSATYVTFPST
jgi:hypothetical protein